jgi:secondary thiamine-phosphate synthase enzyme
MVFSGEIAIETEGDTDVRDITPEVRALIAKSGIAAGLCTVFCTGSTGAVTSIEYEPGVVSDLVEAIRRIAPAGVPYRHDQAWGDGNGFSHVRAALVGPSLTVPVRAGEPLLGTWQQLVFLDFDNRPRRRTIAVQVVGEPA